MANTGTLVVVNSAQKYTGTDEHYRWRLPAPMKDVSRVSLVGAQVPKAIPPLVIGYNNMMTVSMTSLVPAETTADKTFSFTYFGDSPAGLASVIQADLNAWILTAGLTANPLAVEFNIVVTWTGEDGTLDPGTSKAPNRFTFTSQGTGSNWYLTFKSTNIASDSTLGFISDPHIYYNTLSQVPFNLASPGGSVLYATLVGPVQLNFPQGLYLNVRYGQAEANNVWTPNNTYSYYLPFGTAGYLDIENFTAESFYAQNESTPNINFDDIEVEWRVDSSEAIGPAVFPFDIGTHTLVFRVFGL